MHAILAWLSGLSTVGRIGVGVASVVTASAVNTAVNPPEAVPQVPLPEPPSQVQSIIETQEVTETESIAFKTVTKNDSNLDKGVSEVSQTGIKGSKLLTYEVTYTDGTETNRRLIDEEVIKKPVDKIVLKGTYVALVVNVAPASNCDPNYAGGCVPIAYDVDCAGGSGNGPAYVSGPVTVIGSDIYGLDRDGDGLGCE
jgi:hypothetical protein